MVSDIINAVGGLMLETGAPGIPIMDAGYGPKKTAAAVSPKPTAARPDDTHAFRMRRPPSA